MFVASTRMDICLDSVMRNVFWTLASRKNCPHESSVRGPSVPNSPGLGFTRTFLADDPSCNGTESAEPAGTLTGRGFSVQNPDIDGATRLVSLHWGSVAVTKLFVP